MINFDKLNSPFKMNDLLKGLKSIDALQIIRSLYEHQNSLIKFVLIIGSLWMAVGMVNDHRIQYQDLRAKVSQAQEKLDALKARDAAVANFKNFKSSLPNKLNEFELITLISDYAKLNHVTIASLSPAESQDMGLYDIINISFDAVSDNFKDMMLFLRKIEKSEFPLRVNSWSGGQGEENRAITFRIEISAVLIHR